MRKLTERLEYGALRSGCALSNPVIPDPSLLLRMEAFLEIKSKLDYPTHSNLSRIVLILKLQALHLEKPQS